METKLYIRDGKRFKYVPNMLGMYWNGIILTKERMQDSIARVVEQHYDRVVIASLKTSECMMWREAKKWSENCFDGKGRLPSKKELVSLSNYICLDSSIWGEGYSKTDAWVLSWFSSSVYDRNKYYNGRTKAIAVTDVPILNLI